MLQTRTPSQKSPLASARSWAINELINSIAPVTDEEQQAILDAQKDLRTFIRLAWPILEPSNPYHHGWHIDAISEHLEAITNGQIRNLIINIPPRHMKSLTVSVFWPTWEWLTKPETRWIFGSYSSMLSRRDNGKALQLIQSPWFQERWGHIVRVRHDTSAKARFENTRTGFRFATSVTGSLTGEGGDRLVADDPHNVQQADSVAYRTAVHDWWDAAMASRGNNPQTVAKLIIMQRVHEDDLVGHCLAQGGYEHLCLPAEFDGKRRSTSLGSYDPRVTEGELLWPEHFRQAEVDELKLRLGPYGTAGQLQQNPAPAEGGLIKRVWFRFWQRPGPALPPVKVKTDNGYEEIKAVILPEQFDRQIQSWDCSFKGNDGSDYVVGQVWAQLGSYKFLLDQLRDKLNMPQTVQAVRILTVKHPETYAKLIEDKANGPAVIATLHNEISGLLAVQVDQDKIARVHAVVPQIHAGNVFLPHPLLAPFIDEYINELASFPNASYDDQVDATTQALMYLEGGGQWSSTELNL